ncbi:hypothetical protein DESUT3_40620 [Desulfuromonas versatilis]|uniref:Uncharacterized protein n=1 Tax=Desulfuromonas versatilis TaxID=2802975 RepID=A0ABM8I382_9BACT|nr:hypothetical protein [Desulfuromonas versatilis]BCR06993.1 hypothetical protein DESUT3_40620 [Desulfuromonas versatilis]
MKRSDFNRLCSAVLAGEEKFVENLETHETGKVLACRDERLEVLCEGARRSWAMANSEETMGSRYGHKEQTLDTHPWDTDRFNPYR